MNKSEILLMKINRVAQGNMECSRILYELVKNNAEDIIEAIADINKKEYNAITPQGIIKVYRECDEDIKKFIKVYDKLMDSARWIRQNYGDA